MKFNNDFIAATLTEAADIAATRISQNFALNQIAENGSCTLEEAQNMYELAHRVLTEGAEDMIPENLDIPTDATDDQDPTAEQDAAVDSDVDASAAGDDLDLSDLEGIILPDSEGNQYIIQGGILVPYEEDDSDSVVPAGDTPNDGQSAGADDGDGDVDPVGQPDEDLEESTKIEANAAPVEAIEESSSIFANNSSIVANMIKNMNFAK